LPDLKPRWDEFTVALEAFHDMLDEQRDALRASVEERVKATSTQLLKFASRWQALKPSTDAIDATTGKARELNAAAAAENIEALKKWRENADELVGAITLV
jgi:dynein heavy chain 2